MNSNEHMVMLQADRGVANELAEARADWQASLAEDARELKVSCLPSCFAVTPCGCVGNCSELAGWNMDFVIAVRFLVLSMHFHMLCGHRPAQ